MIRRVTGLVTALALLFCAVGALAAQVLEDGSSGETVSVLSKRLCDLGYLQEISSEYDETVAQAVMISAACPTAAVSTLFANRFHLDADYSSEIVSVSTLLSILTIPLIMMLFHL